MAPFTVVICEPHDKWAARLRCELDAASLRLRETRRLVDCQSEVAAANASLVLLGWSAARRSELAEFVDRLARRFPQTQVVALADYDAAGDGPLAREAGAVHFAAGPRELGPVVRLIRRLQGRQSASGERPAGMFADPAGSVQA